MASRPARASLHHGRAPHAGLAPTSTQGSAVRAHLRGPELHPILPSIRSICGSEKAFVFRRLKFNAFADVQNVTNRKNPEEIIYSANYSQRDYITGLPVLAVVGARVEF